MRPPPPPPPAPLPPRAPPRLPLAPLRAPLPSLFVHRQTQQQRDGGGDAPLVPPLRRPRRADSELARHHERNSESQTGSTQFQAPNKRFREVAGAHAGHESEASWGARDAPVRAKKPAYLSQREERQELLDEAQALAAEIERLRRRAGLPTHKEKSSLADDEASNASKHEKLCRNHLFLGRLHSMVTNDLLLPAVNTMSTFIHLPRAMDDRRAILRGMLNAKLRRGIEVATERLHHLDHTAPYQSEERFMSATGEYHWHRFAIHQFPNFQTARQLVDTNVKFLCDLDINLTEMLRQVTLREDTEDVDQRVWNQRLITVADDVGCTEELNVVGFAQFYNHSPATNSPLGVIVYDTVNVDDLYPYVPEERTCKDVQTVSLIYEVPKPGTTETVVVLKFCAFVVQLVPQFALPPGALRQLQENTPRWPDAILKYLQTYVVASDEEAEC